MILTITPNPLLDYQIFGAIDDDRKGTRVEKLPFTVGGKGINVARMLKTLGRPALALSFAGGGNGAKMVAELRQQGINGRFVPVEAETRVGINLFNTEQGGHHWWIEDGEELLESEIIKMLDLIKIESGNASIIAMSGTIPGKRNRDFYRRILEELAGFRGEIYLDARGEALSSACQQGGFFLKHNRDEALETFGLDPFDLASRGGFFRKLADYRIWGAMITDGKENVLLWDGKTIYEFLPAPAREVSAVGCGDATLAGLVYGRRQGLGIFEAALLGLAAGAADAEKAGPCAADYEEIKNKITQVVLLNKTESFQV